VLLRYADPAWLVRLVLGLGGGAWLLEPPDLVAEVGRRARAALEAAVPDQ
jgi:proteasome accessory factor C